VSHKRVKAVAAKVGEADEDERRLILWKLARPGVVNQLRFDTVSCCEGAHANALELVRLLGIPEGMVRAALAATAGKGGRVGSACELDNDSEGEEADDAQA
jgi:hypothetical protein